MTKGTPSMGKRSKGSTHNRCRRCGRQTYNPTKKECASCGYGYSSRMRTYSWQKTRKK